MSRTRVVIVGAMGTLVVSGCGGGEPDQGLLVPVVAAAPADGCAHGTALNVLLSGTGVTYDFEPAASPRDLARASEAVLRGRLTGRVLPVRGDGDVYVDLEVDLTEVVLGEALQGAPELTRLRVVVAPQRLPDVAQTVPALDGAEVVAFVGLRDDVGGRDGGQTPAPVGVPLPVEGLMTGCGDRLAGWVGTGDGWALGSLDEVVVAALDRVP